jgi:hypothetical protein
MADRALGLAGRRDRRRRWRWHRWPCRCWGCSFPYSLVQDRLAELVAPLFADVTFTQLQYSPLVMQWQALQTRRDSPGVVARRRRRLAAANRWRWRASQSGHSYSAQQTPQRLNATTPTTASATGSIPRRCCC